MAIYNLDTSILLDIYEKRGRNGEYAKKLILKIIEENSKIICSDLHITELKHLNYTLEEINLIFQIAKPNNIIRTHTDKKQKEEAVNVAFKLNIPKGDALHAIIARDNNAIMVSRDHDFEKLKQIVEVKKPEDLVKVL